MGRMSSKVSELLYPAVNANEGTREENEVMDASEELMML